MPVQTVTFPAIPAALLAPTPAPEWTGETFGDVVEYVQDLETALAYANADKAAVESIVREEK